jgi:hypothetical protein
MDPENWRLRINSGDINSEFREFRGIPRHCTHFGGPFVEPFGPGFWRRIDLPKAASNLVMKSSSLNGLPVRSCRRSASDSVAEQSVERNVTQFGTSSSKGATFTNASSRPVK